MITMADDLNSQAGTPQSEPSIPQLDTTLSKGQEMATEASNVELKAMGPKLKNWVMRSVKSSSITSNDKAGKHYEYREGNYALIFRGDTFMRSAPFIAKTDLESRQSWAQFDSYKFFGKGRPMWPWEWPTTKIVFMGLNKTEDYSAKINGGGYLIRVDETAMTQVPLYVRLTKEALQTLILTNKMTAQDLLVWRMLNKYEKPRTNWIFYIIIVAAVGIIAMIIVLHAANPNIFNGITNFLNNIGGFTKSFSPPPQP